MKTGVDFRVCKQVVQVHSGSNRGCLMFQKRRFAIAMLLRWIKRFVQRSAT